MAGEPGSSDESTAHERWSERVIERYTPKPRPRPPTEDDDESELERRRRSRPAMTVI